MPTEDRLAACLGRRPSSAAIVRECALSRGVASADCAAGIAGSLEDCPPSQAGRLAPRLVNEGRRAT